jgi:hypothetical protein
MIPNIAIFYHIYQFGNWASLVEEQLDTLFSSGLVDVSEFVHVCINGNKQIHIEHPKISVSLNPEPWTEETPTLLSLRDFCSKNSGWKVLYFHTKGITRPSPEVTDWRKVMEYFCIEQWQRCLEALDTHDAVGCLFVDDCYYGFYPHYSGNFWWANSDYIARLDDNYLVGGIRQNREFWIGSGQGSLFSFHTTGLNHYAVTYPRQLYAN